MTDLTLALPLVIPLVAAVLALLAHGQPRAGRWIGLAGAVGLLASALALLGRVLRDGIQVSHVGDWPAPFGVTLVADTLSAVMVVLAGIVALAVAVYSLAGIDAERERHGYHALTHILLLGVCGAFLTGDIFNLYVWFEVMLLASFVLMALGGGRDQLEGAVKYVTLNLMSSALFLAAVGILYGIAGTLNMADLASLSRSSLDPGLLSAVGVLFLTAFGIKAAVFPLFFWLPASYHTPPPAVSALFAGLLTKVGVYALLRVFTLIFVHDLAFTHSVILTAAACTMLAGGLGALVQTSFRRVLSFLVVGHIGYMIMGLGLYTSLALAGSIFYIVHHVVVVTCLFMTSGLTLRLTGTDRLQAMGGLYRSQPLLAGLFLVPALSLAGVPPLSGFWGKLALLYAGLDQQQYLLVAVALAGSLLTLMAVVRIWNEAFWKPAAQGPAERPAGPAAMLLPVGALALLAVVIGLVAGPLMDLSARAADQLLDPAPYVQSVLERSP